MRTALKNCLRMHCYHTVEVLGFPREISKCSRPLYKIRIIFCHLSPPDFNFARRGYCKDSFGMYSFGFYWQMSSIFFFFQRVIIFSMKSHSLLNIGKCQLYLRWFRIFHFSLSRQDCLLFFTWHRS